VAAWRDDYFMAKRAQAPPAAALCVASSRTAKCAGVCAKHVTMMLTETEAEDERRVQVSAVP